VEQLGLVRIERRLSFSPRRLVVHQQIASDLHPELGGLAGDVPQHGETHDLSLGQEPRVPLDTRELRSDEDTEADKD
jgi:hypothetical protein